ncbi:hypothetical protein AVEN_55068-1 [Araneus ventricosus]|uniref:Reverse transcriptase domain-containing protein n=1 Tax=Araneus ventricosus TaxID=182803 RepID=A0A4Y2GXE2_ARAVE|nr:hypothetical protein AVEN_55068-1 [Araneus ventricosus]
MPILVSGKLLYIKSHPISSHLSPHLVGLDSKDSKVMMSQMLEGILGTISLMDDILIWGYTQAEHDQRLTDVCKRLKNSGSLKFSQSNGLIEAAVKTVKTRRKKSRDPYLALMAYRATPLENGFSLSKLLMGRKINTTLSLAKAQLQSYSVNMKVLEAKEERRIEGQKMNYDKHHGVKNLDKLYPDKNRKHLIPSPDFHPEPEPEDDFDVTGYQHSLADVDPGYPSLMSSLQSPKIYSERAGTSTKAFPDPYVTRSGRTFRPPEKLDL